jgi:mRNA interferase MazF
VKEPPSQGEIWLVDLGRTVDHEQEGRRPALVISVNRFNRSPRGLVVALPITTTQLSIPTHVRIEPPDGGVSQTSYAMCEQVRSISVARLERFWGAVSSDTLRQAIRLVWTLTRLPQS